MAEYKPFVVNFASRGLDLVATPDTIDVNEWAQALNWTTDYEGALNSRLGRVKLNTDAFTQTDVHTLTRLAARGAAYRYAGANDRLLRAATPFTAYTGIVAGPVWIATARYKYGDIVQPTGGNGHTYYCSTVGGSISGPSQPTFPTGAASNVTDAPAAWVTAHVYAAGALVSNSGKVYQTAAGGTSGATAPTHTTGTVTDGTVLWIYISLVLVWVENNFSGAPLLTTAYSIGIDTKPWQIFADPGLQLKDSGTGNPTLFGILPPATVATTSVSARGSTSIETFELATGWTQNPLASITLSQENGTGLHPGTSGGQAYSLKCILPVGVSSIQKAYSANLNLIGGATATDDDLIHIYVQVSNLTGLTEMLLQFSIGDTSFTEYYEKALAPSMLQPGTNFQSTSHTEQVPPAAISRFYDATPNELDPTWVEYVPEPFEDTPNVWTNFEIPRGDFRLNAATDTVYSWANVAAIRIKFNVETLPVTVYLDDWAFVGGGKLSAEDYLWRYVYRNSTTGTISNPSSASAVLTASSSPSRQSVVVTVAQSRDDQVDKIDIYRIGGSVDQYRLSGTVTNNPAGADTTTYTDTISDVLLTTVMETDNVRAPAFIGIELHNETIFGWGSTGDPQNAVRFSKRVYVEQFPDANIIYIGSGSEHVIRLIEQAEQLYAITTAQVYRIVGSDSSSYQALSTGFNHGITSQFAAFQVPGGLGVICYDGIYEFPGGKKISQSIDGIFHGLTVNGISPINSAQIALMRGAFYDNQVYVAYPSGSATANNAMMVYDVMYQRWMPSDQPARTLYAEFDTNLLLMGKTDGWVYQMESGTTDSTTAIALNLRSKYLDMEVPGQNKIFSDMALDINTGGQDLSVQLFFNNGDTSDTAVTVNTATRTLTPIAIASGAGISALNCQMRITGSVSSQVLAYRAIFYVAVQPPLRKSFQTEWTDKGYPYDKYWKEILIEADTGNSAATVHLDVDGVNDLYTFAFTSNGRRRGTLSVTRDTIGKLARLRFTGAALRLYNYDFVVENEPADVTIADSLEQTFGYDRFKLCKRIWLSYKASNDLTLVVYGDNVSKATITVPASALSTGWAKTAFILPPAVKGKFIRCVFTCAAATSFKIYWPESEMEWRPINQERGFARYKFQPPQLM